LGPSLDDLVAADRYGLGRLKSACAQAINSGRSPPAERTPRSSLSLSLPAAEVESGVAVTPASAPRVLEVADLLFAPQLRERAMDAVLTSLPVSSLTPAYRALERRSPRLLADVVRRARDRRRAHVDADPRGLGVRGVGIEEAGAGDAGADTDDDDDEPLTTERVPWAALAALAVFVAVFSTVSMYNTAMSRAVPAVNAIVLLGAVVLGVKSLL
jgi:hypothetical protein